MKIIFDVVNTALVSAYVNIDNMNSSCVVVIYIEQKRESDPSVYINMPEISADIFSHLSNPTTKYLIYCFESVNCSYSFLLFSISACLAKIGEKFIVCSELENTVQHQGDYENNIVSVLPIKNRIVIDSDENIILADLSTECNIDYLYTNAIKQIETINSI